MKITRVLRVRADLLQARTFTDTGNFGRLETREAFQLWFPSIEAPTGRAADTLDAGADLGLKGRSLVPVLAAHAGPGRESVDRAGVDLRPVLEEASERLHCGE